MTQRAAVCQRLRRASARPMAATVSGASTSPSRVMASNWLSALTARAAIVGSPDSTRPS